MEIENQERTKVRNPVLLSIAALQIVIIALLAAVYLEVTAIEQNDAYVDLSEVTTKLDSLEATTESGKDAAVETQSETREAKDAVKELAKQVDRMSLFGIKCSSY